MGCDAKMAGYGFSSEGQSTYYLAPAHCRAINRFAKYHSDTDSAGMLATFDAVALSEYLKRGLDHKKLGYDRATGFALEDFGVMIWHEFPKEQWATREAEIQHLVTASYRKACLANDHSRQAKTWCTWMDNAPAHRGTT